MCRVVLICSALCILFVLPVHSAELADPSTLVGLTVYGLPGPVAPGEAAVITVTADLAKGWHINSNRPTLDYLIPTVLTVSVPPGMEVMDVQYPAPVRKTFSFAEAPLDVYEGQIILKATAKIGGVTSGEYRVLCLLRYQACDDEKCLPPASVEVSFPMEVAGGQADRGTGGQRDKGMVQRLFEERGVLLALILIFWGGLALNLTPCVYPMIPITVAYFGGRGSAKRPTADAVAYFAGIIVTFSLLGTAAGLTGGLFGAALQNPWVLIGLSLLMLYLSAGMFGWVPFSLPASWAPRAGGPLGAFGMGATMGVVAAPCIGPFVVALLAYVGSRQSPALGFLLFSVMAAGLGLPYLLLGLFSGQIPSLPKLGEWMDLVKWVFGFLLLGMAVHFAAPLLTDAIESKLYGVIFLAAAVTATCISAKRARGPARILAVAAAIGLVWVGMKFFMMPSRDAGVDEFWMPYDAVSFESASSSGRPAILDFSAEWCLPCKKMDRTTYADPRVRSALDHAVRLKVDLTQYESPDALEARRKFNVTGVPTLLYFDVSGRERLRLVGEVSADELLHELEKIR